MVAIEAQQYSLHPASPAARVSTDDAIRKACETRDYDRAATLLLEAYGRDIRRFIASRVRSEAGVGEVVSEFHVDIWRGLPGFQWRCPIKAWAFTLARNASNRYLRAPWRRPCRNVALDDIQERGIPHLTVTPDPSETPAYLDEGMKRRVRAIRRQLSAQERLLLRLRVERQMPWRDLTLVIHGPVEDPATLRRLTARMRKRFQLIKERIRREVLVD